MKRKRGFTLVEIMIVIAIIGFITAIAIPSIVKGREKARAAKTASIQKDDTAIAETAFPAVKILTISAQEYCDSIGKKVSDYNMIGFHSEYQNIPEGKDIPRGTEVVVCFRASSYHYVGTALIPKER